VGDLSKEYQIWLPTTKNLIISWAQSITHTKYTTVSEGKAERIVFDLREWIEFSALLLVSVDPRRLVLLLTIRHHLHPAAALLKSSKILANF